MMCRPPAWASWWQPSVACRVWRRCRRPSAGWSRSSGSSAGSRAAGSAWAACWASPRWRPEETAILRQAGAPEWTLRGPLVLQAMTLGAAGAALGVAALVALSETAAPWTGAWLRDTLGLVALPALDGELGRALLGGGLALGLLGGLTGGRP
jgi:hypothetical protein